jgi:hypothetical protein
MERLKCLVLPGHHRLPVGFVSHKYYPDMFDICLMATLRGYDNCKAAGQNELELTAMLRNLGHELAKCALIHSFGMSCGKGSASALGRGFRAPAPTTMGMPAPRPSPTLRGLDARRGFRAPAPTTVGVPAPRPSPTLRGLDARQGLPALDLDSDGPCPSETSRVRAFAPRHPRRAFFLPDKTGVSPPRPRRAKG